MVHPLSCLLILSAAVDAQTCGTATLAVQVLGSGGPIADDARAASGALVWVKGEARVLVDAGGGVFTRFGEAGARFEDLDVIALTHFHADHSSDLPALMQSGTFSERRRPLTISGPTGGNGFPSLDAFLDALFAPKSGAFRYLAQPPFPLQRTAIAEDAIEPVTVVDRDGLTVEAVGVPHGSVPALGYRVSAAGLRIAFSGDQSGLEPHFWAFAAGADLLVMNHAIAEDAGARARSRHAPPGVIGRGAATAKVGRLLLTHRMQRSGAPEEARELIGEFYDGEVTMAEDAMCVTLAHE